jgi:ribose transport system ATP-binding protein
VTRLRARAVEKRFGGTLALGGASLEARAGEVHALLGENGAGKSTLMKIVAGAIAPDAGSLELDGTPYAPAGPLAARRAGVAIVHQEPLLCPDLTVAENVLLGVEPTRVGLVDRRRARELAERALSRVRVAERESKLRPDIATRELAPGDRQLVAIARALAQAECRVLVLDEPTSSLSADDTERLFDVIREFRASGMTVLYISHFLEEVTRIADSFTVLRDGKTVGSGSIDGVTADDLVALMAGRRIEQVFTRSERRPGDVVLELSELAGREHPVSASLSLHRGEVLGIAGLVGAGRTELLRAVFGLDPVRRGSIRVAAFSGPATPRKRLAQGVGLLSEDRKGEGLAEALSVGENLVLSKLSGLGPRGLVLPSRRAEAARRLIERLTIKTRGPEQRVRDLSGGNQQKVALARLLHHDVDVLLLDEPTRGIDVQSRAEIYRVIDELALAGKAVLVVSSHFPELLGIADRIAVMRRGTLGPARDARELDEHALIAEASGA